MPKLKLPEFLDEPAPARRTWPKTPHIFPFLIQRIEFPEFFNRDHVVSLGNVNRDATFVDGTFEVLLTFEHRRDECFLEAKPRR